MDTSLIEWTDEEFSVRVVIIDDQHKSLVEMTNELLLAYNESEDKAIETFRRTVKGLVEYVQLHFTTEEDLMLKYNYPDSSYREHKDKHEEFVNKVSEVLNDFRNNNQAFAIGETIKFLKNWLVNHIAMVDKNTFEFLRETI